MGRKAVSGAVIAAICGLFAACSSTGTGAGTTAGQEGGTSAGATSGGSSGTSGGATTSGGSTSSGASTGSSGSGVGTGSSGGSSGSASGATASGSGGGLGDGGVTGSSGGSVPKDASGSVQDATGASDAPSSGDGSSTDASGSTGPFTCTEVIGLEITSEWWSAGFLSDGVDATKFQIKWHHQGYVGAWADPNSPFWANQGNAQTPDAGAPIQSPCMQNSDAPDRVLFVAVDFEMLTEDAWVTALNDAVATIKQKYASSLKWLDLTTLVRCPNDMMCNPSENYGAGANTTVPREDCYVPPYVDSAIAKVIAAHTDFVGLGPEPQATMCNPTINGPHLSTASNQAAAKAIATYYVQHP